MKKDNLRGLAVEKSKLRGIALIFLATILVCFGMFMITGCGPNNNNNPSSISITVDSSLSGFESYTLTLASNTTINDIKPQIKQVEGYDLGGLYIDAACENQYDDAYVLQNEDVVYCKYEIKHFNITLPSPTDGWFTIQTQNETSDVTYGTEFSFTITYTEDIDVSAVSVTANNEPLTKGQDEVYRVTVKSNIIIDVKIATYTITFPPEVVVKLNGSPLQTGGEFVKVHK